MRILIDIRHLSHPLQSGVGSYTSGLLDQLFKIDGENVYTLLSTGKNRARSFAGDRVFHIHNSTPNKLLTAATILTRRPRLDRLAQGNFDLLFQPNLSIGSIPKSLPTVLTVHDLSWKIFPEFFSKKMRYWHMATRPERMIDHASKIIVPSAATKRDLLRFFDKPEGAIEVVPHGINPCFNADFDQNDVPTKNRLELPERFALFVGTLEPRKNILGLIDGMHAYRKESGDDLPLVLAGGFGWNADPIIKKLNDPLIKPWVKYLGYVSKDDLPALYRSAKVFVWPSIYEGFGLPVLEAMASGTPVITSHTSSLPEIARDGAVMIDPYNPADIAKALDLIVSSNELQQTLIKRGRERAGAYSWQEAAIKSKKIFESINT